MMTLEELHVLFKHADEAALEFSDDAETKVGAVLAWQGSPVEWASNTFVNRAAGLPNTRPDKYQYIVHAEANLIYKSARRGLSTDEATIVCTLSPCQNCIRTMFQSGVREVYYRDRHRDHNSDMRDIKVTETEVGPYTKMVLESYEC